MKTDFSTASLGSSQAPTSAVEKFQSALSTEIQTLPSNAYRMLHNGSLSSTLDNARVASRLTTYTEYLRDILHFDSLFKIATTSGAALVFASVPSGIGF